MQVATYETNAIKSMVDQYINAMPVPRRTQNRLSDSEKLRIVRLRASGMTYRQISDASGRHESVVSNVLKRAREMKGWRAA